MTIDNKEFKKKLDEERSTLLKELKTLGIQNPETGDWLATPNLDEMAIPEADENDMADREEDFQERTSTLNTLEKRLDEVELALGKIKANKFGLCEVCGKQIEDKRLVANPAAKTCIKDLS